MGGPYLILCSENDDLAPNQVICNFAQRLKELGGDVKLVKMNGSPHVGLFLTTVKCSTKTHYKPCCLQKPILVGCFEYHLYNKTKWSCLIFFISGLRYPCIRMQNLVQAFVAWCFE